MLVKRLTKELKRIQKKIVKHQDKIIKQQIIVMDLQKKRFDLKQLIDIENMKEGNKQ